MNILTSTPLSQTARDKAVESTGSDPGEYVYRLHRPTCDRIRNTDSPREIDDNVEAYAEQIAAAKACTRCTPKEATSLVEEANGYLAARVQAEPVAEAVVAAEAPKRTRVTSDEDAEHAEGVPPVYAGDAATLGADGTALGLRPTVYPEVVEADEQGRPYHLYCPAHDATHPVSRFQFVTKRGDGKGRMVECRKAQIERLEHNAANPDDKIKAPRLPEGRYVPKA
jgi:hypothetical protein